MKPELEEQLEKLLAPIRQLDVESIVAELSRKQKECKHENTIRFGPSYTLRHDGSYREHDGYVCKDCSSSLDKYKNKI